MPACSRAATLRARASESRATLFKRAEPLTGIVDSRFLPIEPAVVRDGERTQHLDELCGRQLGQRLHVQDDRREPWFFVLPSAPRRVGPRSAA